MNTSALLPWLLGLAVTAPVVASVAVGLAYLLTGTKPSEAVVVRVTGAGLIVGLIATAVASIVTAGRNEVDFGPWIHIDDYEVPLVFLVDDTALAFSLLAAALTVLVARFSRTYLHKEAGFLRFYVLLGLFSTGAQLISLGGALDLVFLGWELVGLSSTLFIGFFHERRGPVDNALRAFVTYRVCDAGFLFAIVCAHEWLGTTKLSAMTTSTLAALSATQATTLALLFLFAACGKSAQLPFSGWLARAMEGPTPSSALFYGGVSIHAGLLLLLRVHPVLDRAPVAEAIGVVVGLATAVYATAVARTTSDAKGTLAHATLAQVGLILAEISLGWTTLALVHLVGHACLRVWQYLRAPNALHDAHRTHHPLHAPSTSTSSWFGFALSRFRLDDRLDAVVDVVVAAARVVDRAVLRSRFVGSRSEIAVLAGALVVVSAAALVVSGVFVNVVEFNANATVVAVGCVIAVTAGLGSVAVHSLRGLLRAKVLLHIGFLVVAIGAAHDGAIVFAALVAIVAVGGFAFVVDAVEARAGSVDLDVYGGRVGAFPIAAAAFAVTGAAGVGLPGTAGFVADDLLLHAAWQHGPLEAGALIFAAVFMAVGTLRGFARVFLGPQRRSVAPDLRAPERAVVTIVIVVVVVTGLVPSLLLSHLSH